MQIESLEVLEKADVPPGQARAIVRAIELEIAGAKDTLSTKQDIQLLRQDMTDVRRELEVKIRSAESAITRQLYTAIFSAMSAALTVVLGAVYFLFTRVPR